MTWKESREQGRAIAKRGLAMIEAECRRRGYQIRGFGMNLRGPLSEEEIARQRATILAPDGQGAAPAEKAAQDITAVIPTADVEAGSDPEPQERPSHDPRPVEVERDPVPQAIEERDPAVPEVR
jgi:hypothetical protein